MSRPTRPPRADHQQAAAHARQQPGVWLPVTEYRSVLTARTVAYRIRTGRPLGNTRYGTPYTPADLFEARTELTDDGARLDIRYTARQESTLR
ncbi:hypothetical protein KVH27_19320 [Streptomyces olivaceus]|uniref:hypothetical protein n=1 Tax=Streptomyces olivaceus TaxID=47716 RepID=UPI001CCFE0E4|nr:hypothetical protein [Streptomyces olivaceus]MBZ6250518.1 hypothetical protein [Streptomyces olivaceus]